MSLKEAMDWLNLTDNREGDLVIKAISDVSAFISNETGRYFGPPVEHVELVSGAGRNELWVSNPITTLTSVETRSWGTWSSFQEVADYLLLGRRIVSQSQVFPSGKVNVRVTYTAGYKLSEIPGDIVLTAKELLDQAYKNRNTATPATVTFNIDPTAIPRWAGQIIERYRILPGV